MTEPTVCFAVKYQIGGVEWRWCQENGCGTGKATRHLFETRRQAYDAARQWNDARLVRVTRKPKPKPVERETLEGVAEVHRPAPDIYPTRVRLDRGGGQCSSIFDLWMRKAEGKRVRLTFEVFE